MKPNRTALLASVALGAACLSLLLNVYLISQLRRAERAIAPVRPLLEEITGADGTLGTDVRIPAGTLLRLEVPVDERVSIVIDTVVPIRTQVRVPLRSPLGNYDIPVPIRADVPLRASLPVRLEHTFQVRTRTSSDIVVPVELGK